MNYVLYLVIQKDTPLILSTIKKNLTFTPPKKTHLPKKPLLNKNNTILK
jgi:hypothetical protein